MKVVLCISEQCLKPVNMLAAEALHGNIMQISVKQQKVQKNFSVFDISAFEVFAVNSLESNENTCKRQSLC